MKFAIMAETENTEKRKGGAAKYILGGVGGGALGAGVVAFAAKRSLEAQEPAWDAAVSALSGYASNVRRGSEGAVEQLTGFLSQKGIGAEETQKYVQSLRKSTHANPLLGAKIDIKVGESALGGFGKMFYHRTGLVIGAGVVAGIAVGAGLVHLARRRSKNKVAQVEEQQRLAAAQAPKGATR